MRRRRSKTNDLPPLAYSLAPRSADVLGHSAQWVLGLIRNLVGDSRTIEMGTAALAAIGGDRHALVQLGRLCGLLMVVGLDIASREAGSISRDEWNFLTCLALAQRRKIPSNCPMVGPMIDAELRSALRKEMIGAAQQLKRLGMRLPVLQV